MSWESEAALLLYGHGFQYWDYYIVGQGIYLSDPSSPFDQLEVAGLLQEKCLGLLRQVKVPEFASWDEFEWRNGERVVMAYRAHRGA